MTGRVGDASLTFVTEVLFEGVTPNPNITVDEPSPTPTGEAYNWNGQTLYLNALIPETPAEVKIYLTKDEIRATVDDVKALGERFGMSGEIYQVAGEMGSTTDYLVVDGNQQLRVRSDQYFTYYPDYAGMVLAGIFSAPPNAETLINEFMQTHGFNFEYRIEQAQLFGAYLTLPLTPDGFALHHEHFKFSGLMFFFNENRIQFVDVSLLKYDEAATVNIISAQEAFERLLDPIAGNGAGILMGMASGGTQEDSWQRTFPLDQTITYFGYMGSTGKSITGGTPLITLDGYTVTGNIEGVTENMQNVFVEATGQLHEANGLKTFEFQSWKIYDGYDEGYVGTIQREGEQVVINTIEGEKLILPDMPSDVPLPFENAYIMGVTQGDTFEWKSFDTRMAQGGGGGGGGGGLGFYKLNLTGTPVTFPTPTPAPSLSGGDYTVQDGDTLTAIAEAHGVTVEELMQANGLSEPNIFVGQELIIPNLSGNPNQPSIGRQYEGQRGFLTVNIFNKPDGSQRSEYYLSINNRDGLYPFVILEGNGLEQLQNYHNRPVEIWGKVVRYNQQYDMPVVEVERFEIPFPDLQFQIIKGTAKAAEIQGQTVALFTADDRTSYVQMLNNGDVDTNIINDGSEYAMILEALIVPDETYGGYPTLRVYSSGPAISPKNGQPVEITITSDQPYISDEPSAPESIENYVPPTVTIEKVELVYYIPDPRYLASELVIDQRYLQPTWRFYGHYSDGTEFEYLIQALKNEFLLPELAPYTQPG